MSAPIDAATDLTQRKPIPSQEPSSCLSSVSANSIARNASLAFPVRITGALDRCARLALGDGETGRRRSDRRQVAGPAGLEGGDGFVVLEREADVVEAVHQPVAGEVVDLEARLDTGRRGRDRPALEVDGDLRWSGRRPPPPSAVSTVSAGSSTGRRPILRELPRKMSAKRGEMTAAKP